jgi:biotin carboxylase
MAKLGHGQAKQTDIGVKLVMSLQPGYVVRSDFLLQRLTFCTICDFTESFLDPAQQVSAYDPNADHHDDLYKHLNLAVGAVVIKSPSSGSLNETMEAMNRVLSERLRNPWVVPTPLRHPRLVLVGSRPPIVMERWLASAHHLGLRLTVVGAPDQWLQQSDAPPVVEQYIPVDMTPDLHLSDRILQALTTNGPDFNGIFTFTDACFVATAQVAEKLGLRTAPLQTVKTSIDKNLTQTKNSGNTSSMRVKDVSDLETQLQAGNTPLKFPIITKPCFGWGSNGVFLVRDHKHLTKAILSIERTYPDIDIMVESYEQGPEIDANYVLQDGKILFFELVDGFPCTAELNMSGDPNISKDFLETDMVWPSAHPSDEADMVKSAFHQTLLRMGFSTGVFHVEGRIRDSRVHYRVEEGFLDLRTLVNPSSAPSPPSAFLLEVNQRAPGSGATWVTALNYGVDYTALHMLASLPEPARFSSLAQQFPTGPQRHCVMVYINSHKSGVLKTSDVMGELRRLNKDVDLFVDYRCWFFEEGWQVPETPVKLGMFLVTGETREEVLRLAQDLRKGFKVLID